MKETPNPPLKATTGVVNLIRISDSSCIGPYRITYKRLGKKMKMCKPNIVIYVLFIIGLATTLN